MIPSKRNSPEDLQLPTLPKRCVIQNDFGPGTYAQGNIFSSRRSIPRSGSVNIFNVSGDESTSVSKGNVCSTERSMPRTRSANSMQDGLSSHPLTTPTSGEKGKACFRMFFEKNDNRRISPWHDIPLFTSVEGVCNMVCEIPKWTRAKYEVATGEHLNPIKQDEKQGVLREYKWGDMMFNYGMFPQTWEDPNFIPPATGYKGDNDPLDVVEVGTRQLRTGEVVAVKVLGVLAMIDDEETDWKVIVIRAEDALAGRLNNVQDLHVEMPGAIDALREWLRVYKVSEGKPENKFALGGEAMPKEYAMDVILETHAHW
eukprot:CAMPEP_0196571780 /NCGR_PEP_ID=MMETSP1081-20130531/1911_1 /TAXON_ID=36882 /ORGANISM="Pyramimonas amylifera, Strain CCMP720" /LENGTH=313 /DNA_ID=CAMNT_0041888845 /DNA_START=146 /DNA_END=1084 /DNA_ORIENTATION=-